MLRFSTPTDCGKLARFWADLTKLKWRKLIYHKRYKKRLIRASDSSCFIFEAVWSRTKVRPKRREVWLVDAARVCRSNANSRIPGCSGGDQGREHDPHSGMLATWPVIGDQRRSKQPFGPQRGANGRGLGTTRLRGQSATTISPKRVLRRSKKPIFANGLLLSAFNRLTPESCTSAKGRGRAVASLPAQPGRGGNDGGSIF